MNCKHCGSNELELDPAMGQTICTDCGVVLVENNIVSEVQFTENSCGQSSAVGNFVSHETSGPKLMIQDGLSLSCGKSSRQMTYASAKSQINALCHQLNTTSLIPNAAFINFKFCLLKSITKGRKRVHLIAACVYLACRTAQSHIMLIDVSDAVQCDVFDIGRTYLKVSNALCIKVPAIDPCLYMIRFSHRLQFGEMENQVCTTAIRLVNRMKKDWMHTGRRPSGVCGAALVIAARFHNFNRTIQDVIKVVKVHESTVRKRLTEFGSTPSSELTPDQFMNNDLNESEDPPAFKAARRKEEEEKLQKLLEQEKDLSNQFTDLQIQIEKILREQKKKMHGKYGSASVSGRSTPNPNCSILAVSEKEHTDAAQFITESTIESIEECMSVRGEQREYQDDNREEILPSTASMGLKQSIEESMQIRPSDPVPEESGILDLNGIDEDEIDSYILTDGEKESKTNFWMTLNKDYLEEEQKKKEQQKLDDEQRIIEGKLPKNRVYKKRNKNSNPANTAGEAMERMLKVKKLSNKIDYSVLKDLNGDNDDASETHSITSRGSASSKSSKRSKIQQTPLPISLSQIMQDLTKSKTPSEAQQEEQDTECESVPLFKKEKLKVPYEVDDGEISDIDEDNHDDVFGKENMDDDNFRNMSDSECEFYDD